MSTQMDDVYVSLDSLFDTELGILTHHIESKKLLAYLPKYLDSVYHRCAVLDGMIDGEVFDNHWSERNKKDLSNSGGTKLLSHFTKIIREFADPTERNPDENNVNICIDTYPYNISKSEQNLLAAGFDARWGLMANYEFVRIGEGDLTLGRLAKFKRAYIRRFDLWFELHGRKLAKFDCRKLDDTRLFVPPYLIRNDFQSLLDDPNINQDMLMSTDPLEDFKMRLAGMLNVEYLDGRLWRAN